MIFTKEVIEILNKRIDSPEVEKKCLLYFLSLDLHCIDQMIRLPETMVERIIKTAPSPELAQLVRDRMLISLSKGV